MQSDGLLAALAAGAGIVLLLAAAGSIPTAHEHAALDATASVEDVTVSNDSVASLTVQVRNNGEADISPVFRVSSVNWSVSNAWNASGPQPLQPGDSATYAVRSPAAVVEPKAGQQFVVRISDQGESWLVLRPRTATGAGQEVDDG